MVFKLERFHKTPFKYNYLTNILIQPQYNCGLIGSLALHNVYYVFALEVRITEYLQRQLEMHLTYP